MERKDAKQTEDAVAYDRFCMEGTIDSHAEQLLKEIPSKVRHGVVRFDFSRAGRINSMGIALLLRCFKEIRETKKAEIKLDGLTQMHNMLFKMTGVFLLATPAEAPANVNRTP
jgi:ABC-type transporter Mla MlaB component